MKTYRPALDVIPHITKTLWTTVAPLAKVVLA